MPFGGLEREECIPELCSFLWSIVGPKLSNLSPKVPKSLCVCVTVLGDDGGDAIRSFKSKSQTSGGAVIENIDSKLRELEGIDEGTDRCCNVVEIVFVVPLGGDLGQAEAGEIRGYHSVFGSKERDEVAELNRGGWEAVEKEDHWRCGGPGGTVEDVNSICSDAIGCNV